MHPLWLSQNYADDIKIAGDLGEIGQSKHDCFLLQPGLNVAIVCLCAWKAVSLTALERADHDGDCAVPLLFTLSLLW